MPRRRVTKASTKRARPKLPEGNEGNNLSEIERKEKLQIFLEEFDLEFADRIRVLEKEKKKMKEYIELQYNTLINQTPQAVRQMKMKDFISCGGTIEDAFCYRPSSLSSSSNSMKTMSRSHKLDSISEDTSDGSSSTATRSKKSTVRKTRRGRQTKKTLDATSTMPPPSTSSTRSSRFRTPAKGANSLGWGTPLITPKFNPQLPYTPQGLRRPKPGERLMSMDGSPVSVDMDFQKNFRDKTLTLPNFPEDISVDQLSIADIEGDTTGKIEKLHYLLSTFLKNKDTE